MNRYLSTTEDAPSARHRRGPRRSGLGALAAVALAFVASPSMARAQDGSDAALDALIKEIDADKKADPAAKKEEPRKDEPRKEEPSKPAAKPGADEPEEPRKAEEPRKPAAKPAELTGKDKDLDALLESLGETKDEPKAKDERKPPGMPGGEDEDKDKDKGPGDPDKAKDQEKDRDQGPGQGRDRQPGLTGRDKAIDEELEELSGRRRKRNRDRDQQQGEGSGPMGEIIKEMREVEKRLGEQDAGDETRGKQQELVKRLETLIERIRQEAQQQKPGMAQAQTRQKGGKQGEQEGDQDSDNPGGAPNQRPKKPSDRHSLVGGKDAWGHLPPELRQEIENVSKEDSLPISAELIRRYYLAVSRGKLNRGE